MERENVQCGVRVCVETELVFGGDILGGEGGEGCVVGGGDGNGVFVDVEGWGMGRGVVAVREGGADADVAAGDVLEVVGEVFGAHVDVGHGFDVFRADGSCSGVAREKGELWVVDEGGGAVLDVKGYLGVMEIGVGVTDLLESDVDGGLDFGVKGSDGACEICGFCDDVVFCSGVESADGDDGGVRGVEFS